MPTDRSPANFASWTSSIQLEDPKTGENLIETTATPGSSTTRALVQFPLSASDTTPTRRAQTSTSANSSAWCQSRTTPWIRLPLPSESPPANGSPAMYRLTSSIEVPPLEPTTLMGIVVGS